MHDRDRLLKSDALERNMQLQQVNVNMTQRIPFYGLQYVVGGNLRPNDEKEE